MDFFKNFNPERGDVIYGQTHLRDEYVKKYLMTPIVHPDYIKKLSDAWIRIDDYNNATFADLPLSGYTEKTKTNTQSDNATQGSTNFLSNVTGSNSRTVGQKRWAQAYWNAIKNHRNLSPQSVYKLSPQKVAAKEHIPESLFGTDETPLQNRKWMMIRKGCKFGLEYITTIHQGKVHFILDEIDMSDIVDKIEKERMGRMAQAKPITTSELRFAYRNWDKIKHGVIFYRDGRSQRQAPWEDDPKLWLRYDKARIQKYKTQPRYQQTTMMRSTIDNHIDKAEKHERAHRMADAHKEYVKAMNLMK